MFAQFRKLNRYAVLLALLVGGLIFSRPAMAQCPDPTINNALNTTLSSLRDVSQTVVGQYKGLIATGQPMAAQICDPNRYAGGNYSAATLPNYVRASLVCKDPWIAQVYVDLKMNINGHAPTVPDSTSNGGFTFADNSTISSALFSTQGDCNVTKYGGQGSWTTYAQLYAKVQSLAGQTFVAQPVAQPVATAPTQPTGTAAGSSPYFAAGASTPVNLGPVRSNANAIAGLRSDGAILGVNNTAISGPGFYFLAGSNGSALVAQGTGSYHASFAGMGLTVQAVSNPTGLLVDNGGNPVVAVVNTAGSTFTLYVKNASFYRGTANIILNGGGNIVSQGAGNIVSQGAGNIILNGGGNIVSQGAGNIILNGGGNIVSQGAGNLQVFASPAAVAAAQLPVVLGPGLISQDGSGFTAVLSKALSSGALSIIGHDSSGFQPGTNGISQNALAQSAVNPNQVYSLASVKPAASSAPAASPGPAAAPKVTSPAPAVTAPVPIAKSVTPPVPAGPAAVTITSFTPAAVWQNKNPLTFNWTISAATAPANQFVILQMQAGATISKLTGPVWIGSKVYQTPTYDWSKTLGKTTAVTLTLIDGTTGAPVSRPVTITVRM